MRRYVGAHSGISAAVWSLSRYRTTRSALCRSPLRQTHKPRLTLQRLETQSLFPLRWGHLCSQIDSCSEAKYFLSRIAPDVKMDGITTAYLREAVVSQWLAAIYNALEGSVMRLRWRLGR